MLHAREQPVGGELLERSRRRRSASSVRSTTSTESTPARRRPRCARRALRAALRLVAEQLRPRARRRAASPCTLRAEQQVGDERDDARHGYCARRRRNSSRADCGRPQPCVISARPLRVSRTTISASIAASSSSASAPWTVGAEAAWPKRCATSRRQCQSCLEYGRALHVVEVERRFDVARLVGEAQVELEVGPVVGQRVDDRLEACLRGPLRASLARLCSKHGRDRHRPAPAPSTAR